MLIRYMNLSMSKKSERNAYISKFETILKHGQFILGKEVEEFEDNAKEYCKCKYALGVSSGTDALILALKAYDIGAGDEVIIPDISFIATANAVSLLGAKPIFCDVEDDFNISPTSIKELITKKTKAIIVVHYSGKIAQMNLLKKIASNNNLILIEDASQAFGSTLNGKYAGTIGDIGCFSLNPMKPLGALGEAGLIITNNKKIYEKSKALRYNGLNEHKQCIYKSHNAKIDTIQASFLSLNLLTLGKKIEKRRKNANYYTKKLKSIVETPEEEVNSKSVFFTYTIKVNASQRDNLLNYLLENGIEAKVYHTSMSKEPAYQSKDFKCKNSNILSKMKIALPCHEKLKKSELDYVIKTIKDYFKKAKYDK